MQTASATHLPVTTSAARYCRVAYFAVFSDGSGAAATLHRDGYVFGCNFVASEIRIHRVMPRNGSGGRVPAKVLRMVEADYKALLAANTTPEWHAMHAAVYAD